MTIGVAGADAARPAPDLMVRLSSNPPEAQAPGTSFSASATVVNRGTRLAPRSRAQWFLSADRALDRSDVRLGAASVRALAPKSRGSVRRRLRIPKRTLAGDYYLLACADVRKSIVESDETNNCTRARRRMTIVTPDSEQSPPAQPPPAPPSPQPQWAPAATAPIHPGVQTFSQTEFGQCTANFVFTDRLSNVYLGQAAHCTSIEDAMSGDHGCEGRSLPIGTPVEVRGASAPGTLAYNSWLAMQAAKESDGAICHYNDFALIRLEPPDAAKVNPSVPGWGGPVGLASFQNRGDDVYAFGNSGLRGGVRQLSPKRGLVLSRTGMPPEEWSPPPDGWSTTVYTAPQGIPGDSGSPYMDATGKAAGVLSTWNAYAGWNGISDMPRQLAYAQRHSGLLDLVLVNGTEPFNPDLVHAIIGP